MQQEGRIALVVNALKQGHFTSIRGAAKSYNVPFTTLQRRVRGQLARHDIQPPNYKLTSIEESTLVEWILSMDQCSLSPRPDAVQQIANLLIQKQLDTSQEIIVGNRWVLNFVQRHQALQTRYNRKYDYQRAKCEDPTLIRNWFQLVQNTIAKYSIIEEDIYNFDKTRFQIKVILTTKVITRVERSNRPILV